MNLCGCEVQALQMNFIGGEAFEGLKPTGEVIGVEEVAQMSSQGVVTLSKRRREADCCAELQAAAATSRHVVIAAARSTRCVWADMRWRWTLKML